MDTTRAALRRMDRTRNRLLLAGAIAFACTLLQPAAARAVTTQFTLNPSLSLVAMGGDSKNYAANTSLTMTLDLANTIGTLIPVSFTNFFLPDVLTALGGRYAFVVQSPQNGFTGTLDSVTGAILSNPVTALLQQYIGIGPPIATSTFTFTLTTGTINRGPCGQFGGGPLSGSAMNLNTGSATLVAAGCLPPSAPDTLFGLRLVGTSPPFPVPEPGTLLLLGAGLVGMSWAGRRPHADLRSGGKGPGSGDGAPKSGSAPDTFDLLGPLP